MNDLLGLALSPIVSCAAPVSRPLASSANSSIQKYSADRIQLPIVLDFQLSKGKNEIRNWYHRQPTTQFTCIEHRKETTGRFRHEFVVVHLDNSSVCRFDRRAREDMRGHALKDEGTISEDSAHVITQADTEAIARLDESEVLLSANTDQWLDINFILAVCCGIQSHPEAKSYSLLHYNCYFFSWTLLAIIDRRAHWPLLWESNRIERIAKDWITGLCNRLAPEMVIAYRREQPFWERLTRLGRSAIDTNSHQESLALQVDPYIITEMQKALGWKFSRRLVSDLDEILFPSQISSWLKWKFSSALREGGRLGVQRFLDDNEAGRFDGSTSSVVYMHQSLVERAWHKADTVWKRYEKVLDTFIADDSDIRVWSDEYRSGAIHHVTRRMVGHFKQVEGYGFGKAERSIKRAEDTMTEIWLSAFDMTKDESKLSFL
ncbi:hypothetical protein RSOL_496980 [Rhizoctonia solani AG-3 Rhs1AP]|uniref:Uncharacterized protein n=1 Tax=Rhizoctonia solani AG-3 Rhs1AP TaxID=1086054 RepID=X8JMR0_9AGAM|nr:hypothetical protein RSOL_496980 [Rhizoctonia solani AG-3 Rhs1AP]